MYLLQSKALVFYWLIYKESKKLRVKRAKCKILEDKNYSLPIAYYL